MFIYNCNICVFLKCIVLSGFYFRTQLSIEKVPRPGSDILFHIVPPSGRVAVAAPAAALKCRLTDLGCSVATGPWRVS